MIKNLFDKLCKWIKPDGVLHFGCSLILLMIFRLCKLELGVCIFLTIFAGCTKEIFDILVKKQDPNEDNIHDLICDLIGVLVGTGIICLLNLI